jgi:2-phosphosulfolactate phosphatase
VRWSAQEGFEVRFDWGRRGVERLGAHVDALVIVDVLRFTTAVVTALQTGAEVYPAPWEHVEAASRARLLGAVLADGAAERPSLCPLSLTSLGRGTRVVLPSPNGATCALDAAATGATVVAGCVRNAGAVIRWLADNTENVGVIACGERGSDGSLRPAIEDLLGAAAIIAGLPGSRSPEARVAAEGFEAMAETMDQLLVDSVSGRELVERGHADDVAWAAERSADDCVPVLVENRFIVAS